MIFFKACAASIIIAAMVAMMLKGISERAQRAARVPAHIQGASSSCLVLFGVSFALYSLFILCSFQHRCIESLSFGFILFCFLSSSYTPHRFLARVCTGYRLTGIVLSNVEDGSKDEVVLGVWRSKKGWRVRRFGGIHCVTLRSSPAQAIELGCWFSNKEIVAAALAKITRAEWSYLASRCKTCIGRGRKFSVVLAEIFILAGMVIFIIAAGLLVRNESKVILTEKWLFLGVLGTVAVAVGSAFLFFYNQNVSAIRQMLEQPRLAVQGEHLIRSAKRFCKAKQRRSLDGL